MESNTIASHDDELSLHIAQEIEAHGIYKFDEYALCCADDHVSLLHVRSLDSAIYVAQGAATYRSCDVTVFKNGKRSGIVAAVDGRWTKDAS